jgi:hypothetical protein
MCSWVRNLVGPPGGTGRHHAGCRPVPQAAIEGINPLGRNFIRRPGGVCDDLSRVCFATSDDGVPRFVLLGRLSVYGPPAERLREKIRPVMRMESISQTDRNFSSGHTIQLGVCTASAIIEND